MNAIALAGMFNVRVGLCCPAIKIKSIVSSWNLNLVPNNFNDF